MTIDLFAEQPEYTIDSDALMSMFSDNSPWISKKDNPSLWMRIEELINKGIIISHIEVLKEIKKDGQKGEELFNWAQNNKTVFKDYNVEKEGPIIGQMSPKYNDFVNDKVSTEHADPWLIAQAKVQNLTIISQETYYNGPIIGRSKLPNVCNAPLFNVRCVDLWEFIKTRKWAIQIGE